MTSSCNISLTGKYYWKMVWNVKNDDKTTTKITKTYKRVTSTNSKLLKGSVIRKARSTNYRYTFGANVTYGPVSVNGSTTGEFENSVQSEYTKTMENSTDTTTEETLSYEIEIAPGGSNTMYQLCFSGPGVVMDSTILSNKALPVAKVVINCTVIPILLLKTITVVAVDQPSKQPANAIAIGNDQGGNNDINAGYGGKFTYLVPTYTLDPSEAAVSVTVIIQGSKASDRGLVDMAQGAGGSYRYVKTVSHKDDPSKSDRIRNISLWRTDSGSNKPKLTHYTCDINKGRGKSYLYLCWDTIPC